MPSSRRAPVELLRRALLVVPCLDEEAHVDALLTQLRRTAPGALVVVADGGSTDGTRPIVERHAAESAGDGTEEGVGAEARVVLLHNARRIQSSAVNLAVERYGAGRDTLIRVDAHCLYPDDYVATLLREADRTGADSVVVGMETRGHGLVQAAHAAAQNSKMGNGGSAHRAGTEGEGSESGEATARGAWVDHGHHALMTLAAFRGVGGYDQTFTHNEDAELDLRLAAAGARIYLTHATRAIYLPRATWGGLRRQYVAYGRGRARTIVKHAVVPRLRQMVPMAVAPALLAGAAAPLAPGLAAPLLAAPACLWAGACMATGGVIAARQRRPALVLAGASAALMHAAWSFGFWHGAAAALSRRGPAAPAEPLEATT